MKKINYTGFTFLLKQYKNVKSIPIDKLKKLSFGAIEGMTETQKLEFIETTIKYWNDNGFPYPEINYKLLMKEFSRLQSLDTNKLYISNKKEIKQNNIGVTPINAFHRHRYDVKCRSFKTPIEAFNEKKEGIIKKCMYFKINPLNHSSFRTTLQIFSGVHLASNFRPSAVKFMINKYCPQNGKYLDPSMGYGGRLLGSLTANKLSEYHCCDPCVETVNGNKKILKFIKTKILKSGVNKFIKNDVVNKNLPKVVINNIPFEDYEHSPNYFDLVFTSPPYFNIEKYSSEETQSWKKYSEYDDWKELFLRKLFNTSYKVLKPGAYCAINIAGKVGKHDLEKDTIDIGKEVFGKIHDTIYLRLSKMVGTKSGGQGRNNRSDFKLEPIFIFKKGI